MKLKDILEESVNYSNSKKNPELVLPVYTKHKYDYGDRSNKISVNDVVLKASDSGNVYGRRRTAQRTLKKRSK